MSEEGMCITQALLMASSYGGLEKAVETGNEVFGVVKCAPCTVPVSVSVLTSLY